jgi:hypothetical protein
LYAIDRAESGRMLTRKAILPIAEAILIRDPIYLARLARSPEIIRRIRSRLNVRHSRGDTLKRRFLSRLRIRLWGWSLQIDMRTSDWSSVIVSWVGYLIPNRWRGHRRDRDVKEVILQAVTQATIEKDQYDNWVSRFDSLHQIALSENFRSMSLIEIKKILQA